MLAKREQNFVKFYNTRTPHCDYTVTVASSSMAPGANVVVLPPHPFPSDCNQRRPPWCLCDHTTSMCNGTAKNTVPYFKIHVQSTMLTVANAVLPKPQEIYTVGHKTCHIAVTYDVLLSCSMFPMVWMWSQMLQLTDYWLSTQNITHQRQLSYFTETGWSGRKST